MRMRDWTHAGLVAIAALNLTVTGYWLLGATPKDAQPPTTVINEPTLSLDGCTVKVRIASNALADQKIGGSSPNTIMQPGALPQLAIIAANPGNTPATIHFTANLSITRLNSDDEHDRGAPPARPPVWSKDFAITLQPGQTQSIPFATGAKFSATELATLWLADGPRDLTALTFSAVPPFRNDVVFADTHVEFDANPYVGQSGDNIWTTTQPVASPAQPAAKQVVAKTDP